MEKLQDKIEFTQEEFDKIEKSRAEGNLSEYATKDADAIYATKYKVKDYRSNFGHDIDSILNNVFYARFGDKTQVHSFHKNDDLTRRSLHVQYVSRIARTIGSILNLNLELIEAIAIGHDIGHTPFGHRGEKYLNKLYFEFDKKFFNHNVHSVKVLKDISRRDNNRGLSLQVLDGILSHNGEAFEQQLLPSNLKTFSEFESKHLKCYTDNESIKNHIANSLEGCLVRICDIVAYIGKDRQDLYNVKQSEKYRKFDNFGLGTTNAMVIKNISINIIKNSLGQNRISVDTEVADAINKMKQQNYDIIYFSDDTTAQYEIVEQMFEAIFEKILKDLQNGTDNTYVKKHFIDELYLDSYRKDIKNGKYTYADIAVDYIASMTDDYFIDLAEQIGFPTKVKYYTYFN